MSEQQKGDWLERPGSIRLLWILLYAACGLTVVAELFVHREPHFHVDHYFAFYAILGFVACALLILLAKAGGLVLKRRPDYYDETEGLR